MTATSENVSVKVLERTEARATGLASTATASSLYVVYVSIRQHTSAYVRKGECATGVASTATASSLYVAYVSIRQHTSAYVRKGECATGVASTATASSLYVVRNET
jgi:hypothetical protein